MPRRFNKNMNITFVAGAPPADGAWYLAHGNVIERDEFSTGGTPFLEIIRWQDGLWLDRRGLSLQRCLDDDLFFHEHAALGDDNLFLAEKTVEAFRDRMAARDYQMSALADDC
mgnify:CR=1 FL=1